MPTSFTLDPSGAKNVMSTDIVAMYSSKDNLQPSPHEHYCTRAAPIPTSRSITLRTSSGLTVLRLGP